jgi:hypothetical protein
MFVGVVLCLWTDVRMSHLIVERERVWSVDTTFPNVQGRMGGISRFPLCWAQGGTTSSRARDVGLDMGPFSVLSCLVKRGIDVV